MKKELKILIIALVLSLPFWWGMNLLSKNLQNFFFWQEINRNPQIFAAQLELEERFRDLKPLRDKTAADLEVEAASAISVFLDNQGEEKVLFEKEINKKLPFASLAKLMTASVVLEHYDLTKEITISQQSVAQEEDFGKLRAGKTFPVDYLLYPLLMESSNDAAYALASDYEGMNERKFVELMNLEAERLGMKNTFFDNPTGLDPEESGTELNYTSVLDLVKLTKELLKEPLVWQILSTPEYDLYGPVLVNTNELLGEIPGIVGGKTGYTGEAGKCMLLTIRAPKNQGYLINVVLGTNNKFEEMRKLANWLRVAYIW